MKIHACRRAMLMRSVLLMVGIIILSASDCEMAPPTFAYVCTNGTAAEGTAPAANTPRCSACADGYDLVDNACTKSSTLSVTHPYVCTNGEAVVGKSATENTQQCSDCLSGFELNGADACVALVDYICTAGTPATGKTIVENTEKCSACEATHDLVNNVCVADLTSPAVVADLAASPGDGAVQLDWTEPADDDFSHLLISWTPNAPAAPTQVDRGTTTTVIAAGGLTIGTEYTFTAVSVDERGNESAPSTGATARSCPDLNPIFTTTADANYEGLPLNIVLSGSGSFADPYLLEVESVTSVCPINIAFNHSIAITTTSEVFRIDNMPAGASYTSSAIAWAFKDSTPNTAFIKYQLSSDGSLTAIGDVDVTSATISKMTDGDMGTLTDDTDLATSDTNTFGFRLINGGITSSLTLTLTP